MAVSGKEKVLARARRHERVRNKIMGTPERPRLSVYRSLDNIYAQIIDDLSGKTLAAASSLTKAAKGKKGKQSGGNIEAAKMVGAKLAALAKEKNISKVVFDRGGYIYHGRVKALADAAREGGLVF
ncbi:MAG: 50S ribosomal protein L18 [Candidatus Manganitrophus sp.]|nr:50S ribosomal protein L18 [Candidatus Manganitrophus sp.]WDT76212.1 MAG: 50S ribosomal protein L18 [Candidatus Manganitrophus sp.]